MEEVNLPSKVLQISVFGKDEELLKVSILPSLLIGGGGGGGSMYKTCRSLMHRVLVCVEGQQPLLLSATWLNACLLLFLCLKSW